MLKIKILVINTVGLKREGITQVIYDYYSRFLTTEFEIHIVSWADEPKEVQSMFRESGMVLHTVRSRKKELLAYVRDLFKICRSDNFDIMHVNGNSATMAIELSVGKFQKIPCRISHVHNSTCDAKTADKILRPIFYRIYTEAFACGELAGKWMYGERNFSVIRNGRQIDKYSYKPTERIKTRKALCLTDGEIAVGHIGNFNKQKNHQFLISVFNEIHKMNNLSKLFLAGYGHCESSIRDLVRDMGLQDSVVFMGVINNVEEILQAMDVMLLPSLHEGLPLVVVEWQLAALPCLISDTITTECAFSDLVKFKSLSDGASEWATDVFCLCSRNRSDDAESILEAARSNGYDIDMDVQNLMNKFKAILRGDSEQCLHMKD